MGKDKLPADWWKKSTDSRVGNLTGDQTYEDFLRQGVGAGQRYKQYYSNEGKSITAGQLSYDSAATQLLRNRNFGGPAADIGLASLVEMLYNRGRSDPAQMNRELRDIDRTTQSQQDAASGQLAMSGMQGSGLGAALQAAIGQSGAQRRGDRMAQETATAEDRRRNDLGLLKDMIINPALDAYGINKGVDTQSRMQNSMNKQNQQNAIMSMFASIFGAL